MPSLDTERSGCAAGEWASSLDDAGRIPARIRVELHLGVLALADEDVATGALDQGVDPHHVALVLVGLHADGRADLRHPLDDLVPGDRLGHVQTGRFGE